MEFTMKKLLAIFAVLVLASSFSFAQTSYCHDEATGTFKFTVEQAIKITPMNQSLDEMSICPGCYKTYDDGAKCLNWTVTGGADCNFQITYHETLPTVTGVLTYTNLWEKSPNVTPLSWTGFSNKAQQVMGTNGWLIRNCLTKIGVDCYVAPGRYEIDYTVDVDYACDGKIS